MQSIQKSRTRRFLLTVTLLTTLLAVSCGKNPDSEQPGGDKPNKEECVPSKCASKRCDPATNKCADADPVFAKADTGGKCTSDDDCLGGSCLKDSRWSDGYCSQQGCTDADSCSKNEGSTVTLGCMASVTGDGGYCIRTCEEDSDCGRENYECVQESGTGYCAISGTKGVSPEAAQKAGEECFDIGVFEQDASVGNPGSFLAYKFDYEMTLPEGVKGLTINAYVKEKVANSTYRAAVLVPTIFKEETKKFNFYKYLDELYWNGALRPASYGITPLQLPLSKREEELALIKPGKLTVTFTSSEPERPKTFCILKKFVTEPGDTIDMNMYLVGIEDQTGQPLTPETAENDPDIAKMLETVNEIYGSKGLHLGKIRYLVPSEEIVEKYQIVRPDGPTSNKLKDFDRIVRDLVQNTRPQTDNPDAPHGINVFIVKQFSSDFARDNNPDADRLLGTTTGIPGASLLDGTKASGLVFSAEGLREKNLPDYFDGGKQKVLGARVLGLTLAHEMGHFLGLFHTTEFNKYARGEYYKDPLEDTVFCQDEELKKGKNAKIIRCADAANFMFAAAIQTNDPYEITDEQRDVMAKNPLFYKKAE